MIYTLLSASYNVCYVNYEVWIVMLLAMKCQCKIWCVSCIPYIYKEVNQCFLNDNKSIFYFILGYSYTKSSLGYAVTSDDVANHGTAFLRQFFTLFSEYQTNELYLAGECFAGNQYSLSFQNASQWMTPLLITFIAICQVTWKGQIVMISMYK